MFRSEFVGKKFDLAVGVDHATGAFAQLWAHPIDAQDCAFLVIDLNGVSFNQGDLELPPQLVDYIHELKVAYDRFHACYKHYPNLSAIEVTMLARKSSEDFSEGFVKIYALLD